MLTLERLAVRTGEFEVTADLNIPAGARVAVMGPSGAGKSTLLAAIAGFLPPARGRVLWKRADLSEVPPGKRPVSTIFQDNNLFPHLTAAENVAIGVDPSMRLRQAERDAVSDSLARVGLAGFETRKPAALSGGQQSRVALARMLLRGRPIVLLDEPFAALGPALKAEMLDLVIELGGTLGATVLMVTHDPGDARRLGGEILVLDQGRAHEPAPVADVLADPPEALRRYLG